MSDIFIDALFCFTILMCFIVSLWIVDISLAGIICNRSLVSILGVDVDPNFSYHAGLMLATICFFLILSYLFYVKLQILLHNKQC